MLGRTGQALLASGQRRDGRAAAAGYAARTRRRTAECTRTAARVRVLRHVYANQAAAYA